MRFNTENKRAKYAQQVKDYLTDYGYGQSTAEYEVNNWIRGGMAELSPSVREDIRIALINIQYEKSHNL